MSKEDNLRKWPKGTSGNPKGRKKGSKNRSTIIKEILEKEIEIPKNLQEELADYFKELPNELCVEELMTLSMVRKVICDGNVSAYVALMDSAYGKAYDISVNTGAFADSNKEELDKMFYLPK